MLSLISCLCQFNILFTRCRRRLNSPRRLVVRDQFKCDGTRAETRFRLSPKRTSPFKSAGASFQSTAGSRGVRISVINAGCTTFRGSVRVLAIHSIRQFPLHFPSRASPCAIRFQTHSTKRTAGFKIKYSALFHRVHFCSLYDCHNKRPLFPYTEFTNWSF